METTDGMFFFASLGCTITPWCIDSGRKSNPLLQKKRGYKGCRNLLYQSSIVMCKGVALSFKSVCQGQVYRHIVLLLRYQDKWGTLGLSRCPQLMDKDMVFSVLSFFLHTFCRGHHSGLFARPINGCVCSRWAN
jgi:hypothetical protein